MTIIVASRFLKSMLMVADCRVSYVGATDVDDNLQKLYQLDERMVLGFCGPLSGAFLVMDSVRKHIKAYPKKRAVAVNLQTDVRRWIQHAYRELLRPEDRKGLSFILASVEPRREQRSRWFHDKKEIPKPKWFPFVPELRSVILTPSQSHPERLIVQEKGSPKIIGVAPEVREIVEDQLSKFFGFAHREPYNQAIVVVNAIMYALMQSNVPSVGGLFQCALLSSSGIEWLSYRLPSGMGDVSLSITDGHYLQQDAVTGRTVPVMTIWEWWESRATRQPGSSGIFEDPGLRSVVDRQPNRDS